MRVLIHLQKNTAMDVIFLHSNELNWGENFLRAKEVIGADIKLINGSNATSLKNAYEMVLNEVKTDHFMMIEADNFVLDVCTKYLDVNKPMKFWTVNKYGITYEHGGIKILNRDAACRQIERNSNIYENFEISANLMLESSHEILSEHRFDWSPKNEWVSIAKELIKLYYWDHTDYINMWIAHKRPQEIYDNVHTIIQDVGFTQLFETLLPSLGTIYETRFKN
jgi:hypothetical protein